MSAPPYYRPARPHRARRRLVKLLIALLVLLALLIAADRISAALADRAAAKQLADSAPFARTPSVTAHGFPFLTQAIRGDYDNIEVSGGGLQLGPITDASLDAHLHGVHLPLSDVISRSVTQLPVDEIDGTVTLPYAQLGALGSVVGLQVSSAGSSGVRVAASLPIPGLGVSAQVSGTASAMVVGGALKLTVTQVSVNGLSVPSAVLSELAQLLSVSLPIPALPYGLHITAVQLGPTGAEVSAVAQHVVLTSSGTG